MPATRPTCPSAAEPTLRRLAQVLDEAVEELAWTGAQPAPELQEALTAVLARLSCRLEALHDRSMELVRS